MRQSGKGAHFSPLRTENVRLILVVVAWIVQEAMNVSVCGRVDDKLMCWDEHTDDIVVEVEQDDLILVHEVKLRLAVGTPLRRQKNQSRSCA
jgi:hypothetical protein